jgi:hypothetical protein
MINLQFLHCVAMPLAAWRLTELMAQDQITLPLRKRFPGYVWTCHRCLSVWAGAMATSLFLFLPLANWPFALSWLYLWMMDSRAYKRQLHKRSFVVVAEKEDHLNLARQELTKKELGAIVEVLTRPEAGGG